MCRHHLPHLLVRGAHPLPINAALDPDGFSVVVGGGAAWLFSATLIVGEVAVVGRPCHRLLRHPLLRRRRRRRQSTAMQATMCVERIRVVPVARVDTITATAVQQAAFAVVLVAPRMAQVATGVLLASMPVETAVVLVPADTPRALDQHAATVVHQVGTLAHTQAPARRVQVGSFSHLPPLAAAVDALQANHPMEEPQPATG